MKKVISRYLPIIIGKYINTLSIIAPKKAMLKAAHIFSTPRKGNVQEHQYEFLEKAKATSFTYENYTIQTYQWHGNGKTILLAHGWESNSFRWRKLIKELQKKDFNIIAIDAPAHGNSSGTSFNVPLYTECVEKTFEKFSPEIIIGHSLGGMTAIYHQYKYSNPLVKKIVVLAPPSELSRIMKDYQKILNLDTKILKNLERHYKNRFGFNFDEFSVAEFSKTLKQPGLIIHDETDNITPMIESETIHKNWKASAMIKTNGFDHSLQDKNVYNYILDFLDK
ncbi:alpha/beta fold hydrolase [Flavobacteriaceae bacterium R38]|nr:alpha/beta fold hydrolase [Flavobacteriaceae bacterium R38]